MKHGVGRLCRGWQSHGGREQRRCADHPHIFQNRHDLTPRHGAGTAGSDAEYYSTKSWSSTSAKEIFEGPGFSLPSSAKAVCRRRHQPRRPPLAKIRPGSPAPAMGPGSAESPVVDIDSRRGDNKLEATSRVLCYGIDGRSPRLTPMRNLTCRFSRNWSLRVRNAAWISVAQRTASTALLNSARIASPAVLKRGPDAKRRASQTPP